MRRLHDPLHRHGRVRRHHVRERGLRITCAGNSACGDDHVRQSGDRAKAGQCDVSCSGVSGCGDVSCTNACDCADRRLHREQRLRRPDMPPWRRGRTAPGPGTTESPVPTPIPAQLRISRSAMSEKFPMTPSGYACDEGAALQAEERRPPRQQPGHRDRTRPRRPVRERRLQRGERGARPDRGQDPRARGKTRTWPRLSIQPNCRVRESDSAPP